MKNFFIGMFLGVCLAFFSVLGYSKFLGNENPISSPSHEVRSPKTADLGGASSSVRHPRLVGSDTRSSAKPENSKSGQWKSPKPEKRPRGSESSEGVGIEEASPIELLAEYYDGRTYERESELRKGVEGLKERGTEALPELLKILRGDYSDTAKIIAASVLGEINAELQDSDIAEILSGEVLPLLESIVNGDGRRLMKQQAIIALGEIGTEGAQQILTSLLTGETNRWTKRSALRVLEEKGNLDSAHRLLPVLDNAKPDTQFLLAARAIAMINRRENDPDLASGLAEALPVLEKVIRDATESTRQKHRTLMTLGSIGNEEANRILLGVAEGTGGADDLLQRTALRALVRSGSPEITVEISEMIEKSTNVDQQIRFSAAIVSIANRNPNSTATTIAQSHAMPTLRSLINSSEDPRIQRRAINTLGRVGKQSEVEFLQQVSQTNEELEPIVSEAIRQIQDREQGIDRWARGRRFGRIY